MAIGKIIEREINMQDFLSKLGKTASSAASVAGNKAGELVEVGRLKSKISTIKSDINAVKKEMGDYCLKQYDEGVLNDETLEMLCGKIVEMQQEIEDLEEKVLETKAEYQARKSDDNGPNLND